MEEILPVLIQFPLLAIFVWFTFEMNKRFYGEIENYRKCDAEDRQKRDSEWRDFLRDQRDAQCEGFTSVTQALKEVSAVMNATAANNSEIMRGLKTLNDRMEAMGEAQAVIGTNVAHIMDKFDAHDSRAEQILREVVAHEAVSASSRRSVSQGPRKAKPRDVESD